MSDLDAQAKEVVGVATADSTPLHDGSGMHAVELSTMSRAAGVLQSPGTSIHVISAQPSRTVLSFSGEGVITLGPDVTWDEAAEFLLAAIERKLGVKTTGVERSSESDASIALWLRSAAARSLIQPGSVDAADACAALASALESGAWKAGR